MPLEKRSSPRGSTIQIVPFGPGIVIDRLIRINAPGAWASNILAKFSAASGEIGPAIRGRYAPRKICEGRARPHLYEKRKRLRNHAASVEGSGAWNSTPS
jgi:hypothetical protein